MSTVQWLLLILVIVIVAGVYWYIRRAGGGDPWHDMDESDSSGSDSTPGGGSYIVGVRRIKKETPADRKAARQASQAREREEDAPPDRTRAVRQPTAVRRRPATDSEGQASVRSSEAEPPNGVEADEPATEETASEVPPDATERLEMVAPQQSAHSQVFQLFVAAHEDRQFQGPAIHETLCRAGLKFGLNDLYHRVTEVHGVTESVFCVANILNPGTLDPVDQDHLSTPGLALFLLVPAPFEGRAAMQDMMETANQLANDLGGQVLDDNRSMLKAQTAQYMFDQVADIERRAKLAQRR